MATSVIKLTATFADKTTREIELGTYSDNAAVFNNIKSNIAAVNANASDLAGIYISEGGADFVKIVAADITTTETRKINLHVGA